MPTQIREHVVLPELKQPVLISAFTSAQRGGQTACAALAYLMSQWDAELVAELESDDYYDYARLRPMMRQENGKPAVDWPTNLLYHLTPPDSERDFLVLVGMEPSMRWRAFVQELADYIEKLGITEAISMRSFSAAVSHRRPTTLQAQYSTPNVEESFDLPAVAFTGVPLDVAALLNLELRERGVETADLMALEPCYTGGIPDAKVGLALLQAVGRAYNLKIPAESLKPAIDKHFTAMEQAVLSSEEVAALVQAIDEHTDAMRPRQEPLALPEVAEANDNHSVSIIDEIEAFLRQNQ